MQMWHKRKDESLIQFALVTEPPEAMYWTTYKLKVTDVQLVTKVPAKDKTHIRREIYEDIVTRERAPHTNTVSKKRKDAVRDNAKTRRKQQKTR
jgi:hypothetical protein